MTLSRFTLATFLGHTFIAIACLLLSGCATVKADAKSVADVCRPELGPPDAAAALPLVAALAVCEASSGDCSGPEGALEALGKADAIAAAQAALTQCPRGHGYDGSNLRLSNHGRRRHCRACAHEWPSRRRQ